MSAFVPATDKPATGLRVNVNGTLGTSESALPTPSAESLVKPLGDVTQRSANVAEIVGKKPQAIDAKESAPVYICDSWAAIANATSEEELLQGFTGLMNELQLKGPALGLTKKVVVTEAKKKRSSAKEAWTKKVAGRFGAVLKMVGSVQVLEGRRQKALDRRVPAYLQKFGCLHGEQFKTYRFLSRGGLLSGVKFISIECGGQHAAALTPSGTVYTWGSGSFGQLGHGDRLALSRPRQVSGLPDCKQVACGYAFSAAVAKDGTTWSWGAGENGRLGNGQIVDVSVPTAVVDCPPNERVFAGSVHTVSISVDHKMYAWGHKNYTGHGLDEDIKTPMLLDAFGGRLMLSASIGPGGYHTIALSLSGEVFTWGHNRVGQLGFENDLETNRTKEGAYFYPKPVIVRSLAGKQVRQVSAGWGHSMVLLWDGTVLSCGRNYRGQLGIDPATCPTNQRGHPYNPTFSTVPSLAGINIEQISCGGEHSAAIATDGSLYIWGDDACAQLAQAGDLSQVYGEDEPKFRAVATRAVGEPELARVTGVALGSAVTFVLTGSSGN